MTLCYVLRYVLSFGKCYVLRSLGTTKRNTSANVKECYVLRDPYLCFGSYAVEIIITFCLKLLRFGLSSYVLWKCYVLRPALHLPPPFPIIGRLPPPNHTCSFHALCWSSISLSMFLLPRSTFHFHLHRLLHLKITPIV